MTAEYQQRHYYITQYLRHSSKRFNRTHRYNSTNKPHLQYKNIIKFLGQILNLRSDHLARSTPCREEINNNEAVSGIAQFSKEIILKGDKRSRKHCITY